MGKYSKAIGAAVGGGAVGGIGSIVMPPDTPWWGYIVVMAISIIGPALATYIAPKNAG